MTAVALAVLLLAALISSVVSADALSTRSITPSSSSISAEGVEYTVKFTPAAAAGAFVIDFCSNTPLLGQSCTAPTNMDVSAATTSTAGVTLSTAPVVDANTLVASKTMTAIEQEITFSVIDNPSTVGATYARIVTFASLADAEGYTSTNPEVVGTVVDNGSVAMYFNNTIGVSGTVLETLEFCVSSADITANCANATQPTDLELGEDVGGVTALQASAVSTGDLFTQINTNAASGAVVRLRSSAECGGLKRSNVQTCDIAAAQQTGIAAGEAKFGLILGTPSIATDLQLEDTVGTLRPYDAGTGPFYGATYAFNYDNTDVEGVTSPFGDPFLDTNGAPAVGRNMQVTFGASISNNTPAGTYSTDLSMIAVGKF